MPYSFKVRVRFGFMYIGSSRSIYWCELDIGIILFFLRLFSEMISLAGGRGCFFRRSWGIKVRGEFIINRI